MFTGLVETSGRVLRAVRRGPEVDLYVDVGGLRGPLEIGASISISGVCCTLTALRGGEGEFRLSAETLRRTWLGEARPPREVNLEAALRAGDPMGGHIVQGHVDATGEVVAPISKREGGELGIRLPEELMKYCVEKGSVAIDGVSLTVARLEGDVVTIAVIPHTAQVPTLGGMARGQKVHVEVDILAKYVERLLAGRGE